jgi:hypothetical protein
MLHFLSKRNATDFKIISIIILFITKLIILKHGAIAV